MFKKQTLFVLMTLIGCVASLSAMDRNPNEDTKQNQNFVKELKGLTKNNNGTQENILREERQKILDKVNDEGRKIFDKMNNEAKRILNEIHNGKCFLDSEVFDPLPLLLPLPLPLPNYIEKIKSDKISSDQ